MKRRTWSFLLAALAIFAGLVWRLAPLPLPAFAYKYGGSALYAAMLYWLIAAAAPRARTAAVAAGAVLLAWSVEGFKLFHRPALDLFRFTLAGKLLLGRVFTFGALLCYALTVAAIALADGYQRTSRSRLE